MSSYHVHMTELMRVKARWSGFSGGPGYTNLHFRGFGATEGGGGSYDVAAANNAINRVNAFLGGVRGNLPSVVRVEVESEVEIIEDTTGDLIGTIGGTDAPEQVGSTVGGYSGPVGAVVNWRTGSIRNSRRVRGRTFLVPLASVAFGTSGQLTPAAITNIQNAAANLYLPADSLDLMVYGRPTSSEAEDGKAYVVTSFNVPTMAAVLRSRRD